MTKGFKKNGKFRPTEKKNRKKHTQPRCESCGKKMGILQTGKCDQCKRKPNSKVEITKTELIKRKKQSNVMNISEMRSDNPKERELMQKFIKKGEHMTEAEQKEAIRLLDEDQKKHSLVFYGEMRSMERKEGITPDQSNAPKPLTPKVTTIPDEQILEEWWRRMSEAGGGFEVMMEADVNANETIHGIAKDPKNGHDYEYWHTTPAWDEFTKKQKHQIIESSGGIGEMESLLIEDEWIDVDKNKFAWEK